ncbi:MAG: DUF6134 family protein [Sedimenticolaceae bacterium]
MQRREFLTGVGLLAAFGPRAVSAVVNDILPPEGVVLNYRVLFHDSDIGHQQIRIREHDLAGHVVVEHEAKMEVRILFAVAYSLEHRSTEVWEGFTLKSVKSDTVENDQRTLVQGRATDEGFHLNNQENEWLTPGGLVTSDSFWAAAALEAASVVNTRTGDTAVPVLKKIGHDRWHLSAVFPHSPIEATLEFDGGFLREAEVDAGGHRVRLVRLPA